MTRRKKLPLSPWEKIIRAADNSRGLRLTAEEVARLAYDQAIRTVAEDDEADRLEREEELNR